MKLVRNTLIFFCHSSLKVGVLAVPRGHALGEGNAWISKLSLNAFRELLFQV